MTDLVVTVPKGRWADWIGEGDLPGEAWTGNEYAFSGSGALPKIEPGERVYIVAHDKVRGYAPLVDIETDGRFWSLIRAGGAVAVTIPETVRGFQGWRYRWWERGAELEFPDWKSAQGREIDVAIDQAEVSVALDGTTSEEARLAARLFDDPIPPDAPARQAPITQAELRQRALANIIPSWTKARQWLAEVNGDLEDAKGRVKSAKASLERQEASLEHVGSCRLEPCLRCQEIAINPPRRAEENAQDDEEDDEEDDVTDAIIDESRGGLDEADQEPVADADRVAEQEAVQAEADDQVESVSLEPDQRQAIEEIAARGGAERETAEVARG